MLPPLQTDSKEIYINQLSRKTLSVYWVLLLLIATSLTALPFIYVDISVKSTGIIRPSLERTDVKPLVSGIIDTLYYKEGDAVQKNDIIVRLKDYNTGSKRLTNNFEINQRQLFVHDLQLLAADTSFNQTLLSNLSSPLYKEQAARFIHQTEDQQASVRKATKELEMNTSLVKDKVISPKEFFDTQIQYDKLTSAYKAFRQEQLSNWQQDLVKYKIELSKYHNEQNQINTDAGFFLVKAPVAGILQNINTHYAGGLLQTGETLCSISPETNLIGECYVSPQDVGLLKNQQKVIFQIDAFDYNYFGILSGNILSIDNDFTAIDNKPVFKIRCTFNTNQLHLKNGYTGILKKGLTFQSRFVVTRRSLWQLLFDKMDNWLNPAAPLQNKNKS